MANEFGFGIGTTGFSATEHDNIQAKVVETLRAGFVALPRGAVVPGVVIAQSGSNFTVRLTEYPDLAAAAATNPLTEGVAPTALKLAIDNQDFTVAQVGAWTKVTDLATLRSPHGLAKIAADKIARLAADTFDAAGRTALAAVSSAGDTGDILNSWILEDAVAILQGRDVEPIPGVGYYALLHPTALRGLTGESGLNGYIDVMAQANSGAITKGAVGQYKGVTFLTSTKFADSVGDGTGNFPVYMLGKSSLGAGDMSTFSYHRAAGAAPGNELAQFESVGFKGICGAVAVANPVVTDGAASTGSDVSRVLKFTVQGGLSGAFA